MKQHTRFLTILLAVFTVVYIQFTYGQQLDATTIHTVNYTITEWNTSGSFTFVIGTTENPVTKKVEGYIKVTNSDAMIVEFNSQKLESMIQRIESNSSEKVNESDNLIQMPDRKNKMLNKLKLMKAMLEDKDKMKKLIMDMKKDPEGSNSFNWDYTASTIRGISTEVTGNVD